MTVDDESWASVSVRLTAAGLDGEGIATRLGIPTRPARRPEFCLYDLRQVEDEPLADQLDRLSAFLADLEGRLTGLPDERQVLVLIGWSPRRGQDSVGFSPKLLTNLARVGALLLVDTYTDDSGLVDEPDR